MNEAENSIGRENRESGAAAEYGGPAPQASGLWPSTAKVTLYALVRGQQMPKFCSMGCAKGVVLLGS